MEICVFAESPLCTEAGTTCMNGLTPVLTIITVACCLECKQDLHGFSDVYTKRPASYSCSSGPLQGATDSSFIHLFGASGYKEITVTFCAMRGRLMKQSVDRCLFGL